MVEPVCVTVSRVLRSAATISYVAAVAPAMATPFRFHTNVLVVATGLHAEVTAETVTPTRAVPEIVGMGVAVNVPFAIAAVGKLVLGWLS